MYVCLCKGITDSQIRDAVNSGAESLRAVREELGVGTQCGKCNCDTRDLIKATLEDTSRAGLFFEVA
ncbi:MAG: bacterioferritin-associated ferredoxin [Lentisphaeria bacterium]|jgi:bacterioferritin-associated ferredoxin